MSRLGLRSWFRLGFTRGMVSVLIAGFPLVLAAGLCAPGFAEDVVEAWRSTAPPFNSPASVSVNPTDNSCWVADYGHNQVVHVSQSGVVVSRSSGFNGPVSVSVNTADGSCWVADYYNNAVVHLGANGGVLWRGATFYGPMSVSVNPSDGSCWVADYYNRKVAHLSAAGVSLWRGGTLAGPVSVCVDPNTGSCWVADYNGGAVVNLAAGGSEASRAAGFSMPYSVSVDPIDGSCWVADTGNNQVVRLAAGGSEVGRFAGFSAPYSVSVNRTTGTCWVADSYHDQIVHLATDGTELLRRSGFWQPRGVAVDPTDGSCWVADYFNNDVVHLSETGVELYRPEGFDHPYSVSASSADGSCWVADYLNRAVVRLGATGVEFFRGGVFSAPRSVAVNPADGSCWVGDLAADQVVHLAPGGAELWRGGGCDGPWSVGVFAQDGSCWVADYYNNHVVRLGATGTEMFRGTGFYGPSSVSVNANDGSCWVADTYHDQVVLLAPSGAEVWRGGWFSRPCSVSVNPSDGSCWVADYYHNQVVHLAANGSQQSRTGGFYGPISVSVNPNDGSCWVADYGNSAVVHLAADGTPLWRGTAFRQPISVSVNPTDGSCWVADYGNSQVVHLVIAGASPAVTGTVTDANTAAPLQGALVEVLDGVGNLENSATTDVNGHYTINLGLVPGSAQVRCSRAGYVTQTKPATLTAGVTTVVDFQMQLTPPIVTGTVTDAGTAAPLQGALVEVLDGIGNLENSAITDVNGQYTINSGLVAGPAQVRCSCAGYATQRTSVTLADGVTTTVDFQLPVSAIVTGTVRDASTLLVLPGALVQVFDAAGNLENSATTDAGGHYTINSGLAPGSAVVRCSKAGYVTRQVSVTLTSGATTTVNFSLQPVPPPPIVTGMVTDAGTAAPLQGALVEVLDGSGNLENSAVTDVNGQYTINSGLVAGSAQVRCSLTGYVTQVKPATLADGVTTTVDFALNPEIGPSPIVTGTVTDASTSSPLQGALVEVLDGVGNLENQATTDVNGQYTINSGLVAGSAQVRCSKSGYVTQTTPVTLTGGVTTTVNFALQPVPPPSPIVTGTVRDASTLAVLAGALVEVLTVGGVLENSAITDASGHYTINSGLTPGSAVVRCSKAGYVTRQVSVTLTSGATTTVNFSLQPVPPSPIVTGTVTDASTSLPLAGALVEVLDGVGNLENSAVTNASGQYTINSGLTAGSAQVRCSLTGYVTQVKPATLTDGVTTTVDFQLQPQVAPSPIVSGTVTDASTSAPLQGALVEVLDGVGNLENSAVTNASGQYTINSGLTAGSAQVRCSKSGYVTQTTPATLTSGVTTTVDFALQLAPPPSPIVKGTVRDASTLLVLQGALVEVLDGSNNLENSAVTDVNGQYIINSGLTAGPATVRCSLAGYVTRQVSVTLTSGATTTVNFSLQPGGPAKPKGPRPKGPKPK